MTKKELNIIANLFLLYLKKKNITYRLAELKGDYPTLFVGEKVVSSSREELEKDVKIGGK